ncbi:hypothetical protein B0T10DRAFT_493850 [Thelonectria olida]|uniref:Uncharacterized protein n=1 Tax=Thelonectria olida TaxID=1576542 RepID=A0A9P8VZ69_9HYPO|nr:hypothetical protein B0T10DRAFT_494248 [Thelonectria olida]KAH6883809.1 hypothetical protein B0T10DRAFT_493850 [Thelonectria olida]
MEDDHALKLIASIAQKLPSEDFFRFRQTCKEINSGTLPVFANRYFKTHHVMLERRSLSNLITISQHHSLGPSVHNLEICTDHLPPIEGPRSLEASLSLMKMSEEEDSPQRCNTTLEEDSRPGWNNFCQDKTGWPEVRATGQRAVSAL